MFCYSGLSASGTVTTLGENQSQAWGLMHMQSQRRRWQPPQRALYAGSQSRQISVYFIPLFRSLEPQLGQLFSSESDSEPESFLQQGLAVQVLASPVQPLSEQPPSFPQEQLARIVSSVIHTSIWLIFKIRCSNFGSKASGPINSTPVLPLQ